MGQRLVPATIVWAMLAFALAAATTGAVPRRPDVWGAAVSLAVLGAITPMIYAVIIRVVPVFAWRAWPNAWALRLQVGFAVTGAWTVYAGRLVDRDPVVVLGHALALAGGIAFAINVARLFRRPPTTPAPPIPCPEQSLVDKLATRFTRLAGLSLLFGLGVGLATSVWQPAAGRWDLVWAHAMLVGFFLSMAAGVSYHVLARWTGRGWWSLAPIRLHLAATAVGLPLMLVALAADRSDLLAVAGPLQAAALLLYLAAIAPMVPALPGPTRPALGLAVACLVAGIGLGAAFAADPALGPRLRLVHAQLNLFGWAGLLMTGIGYYLVPRFAGRPLRWPRLASAQLGALAAGSILGAAAWLWRTAGGAPSELLIAAQALVAIGFLLFGVLVAATFRGRAGYWVAPLSVTPRSAVARPRPVARGR